MSDFDFFIDFFANLPLFLSLMIFMTVALYASVRLVAPAGYLDPFHFYWTFTFGSAYGVVLGLYFLHEIDIELLSMVAFFGLAFILSFRYFSRNPKKRFRSYFDRLLIPQGEGKLEFVVVAVVYLLILVLIISFVGVGMFAETNRFEQNRGFGPLVRVADALRLFVVAYLSLLIVKRYRRTNRIRLNTVVLTLTLTILIVVGSIVNGAKFALLEAIYAIVVASAIYTEKPKFRLWLMVSVLGSALTFALVVLSANLNNDAATRGADATYMEGNSLVVERFVLRVLANADKYYFSLPNHVIDELKTDNVVVAFLTPFVGIGKMSSLVGYDVSEYSIGRQTLMYFYPENDVAGGPTSHFDLFAYKYFGWFGGPLFVLFISFLLSSIMSLTKSGQGRIFYSSLVAALWLRSQAMILEPTVGLSYVFDIFLLFFILKIACACFHRRSIA
jgi:oligosaccharide repeat unit polymerase